MRKLGLFLPMVLLLVCCKESAGRQTSEQEEMGKMEKTEITSILNSSKTPATDSVKISSLPEIEKVVLLSKQFLEKLTESQKGKVLLGYSKTEAKKWSNFPQQFSHPQRVGIGLNELDSAQLGALTSLLKEVLANQVKDEGFDEVTGTLLADDYLSQITSKDFFGSGNYYFAFLGEPSEEGLWEIQFGGHHLAISNTYNGGELVGLTPSFRGLEPTKGIKTEDRIYQPLEQEKAAFVDILKSLSKDNIEIAQLNETFKDVLMGPGKDTGYPTNKAGLKISELRDSLKQKIMWSISLYVKDIHSNKVPEFMERYAAQLDDTYLSFSGSTDLSNSGDYLRIDGPDLWIEYSVQPAHNIPNETHPHSIWRDKRSDYGSLR